MGAGKRARGAKAKREPLDAAALYEHAVKLLAARMRTVSALEKLLKRRAAEGPLGEANVKTVLRRLTEQNYLNDERYAEYYTRLRQENERHGRRRVAQDLMHQGIQSETMKRALEKAYAGVDELALCRAHMERKRMKAPKDERETARMVGRLLRAGFGAGVIYKALKQWRVEDGLLEGIEAIEAEQSAAGGEDEA